jgi:hypothetical protein
VQKVESLGHNCADECVDGMYVSFLVKGASDNRELHWVNADAEQDWDLGGRSLSRESRKRPDCDDHSHLKLDQISHQRR